MQIPPMMKLRGIKTSKTELIDITKAWIALSLAFAFIYSGASLMGGSISNTFQLHFLKIFVISLFTAGLGFLLHELGHKFVSQHYGCTAEFRAWNQFLYLAVGLAVVIGFIFAAPGAVMIHGMVTRKENGIISAAGPLVNYVLGLIFLGLFFTFPAWRSVTSIGFSINMWLGLFNLIPFGNLDGLKIFHWNKVVWGGMAAFGIIFVFVI